MYIYSVSGKNQDLFDAILKDICTNSRPDTKDRKMHANKIVRHTHVSTRSCVCIGRNWSTTSAFTLQIYRWQLTALY